ncbi:unnamed protein product [Rhizoctonia solani]|uniref:Uncharacterized protein n=1 Tax=Rhizoctonia solani TaxID=456999 RepID=A0A8H3CXV7_9AGAM|nr:unnamed protein product [Rhizoctonia solani]
MTARFQAFLAFKKAGKPKQPEEGQCSKPANVQPPTVGKSPDPVELQGEASTHGDN